VTPPLQYSQKAPDQYKDEGDLKCCELEVPPWPGDPDAEEQLATERHLLREYEARTGKLPRPPEELLAGASTQQQLAELCASEQVADELSTGCAGMHPFAG
jgi:hypothetical protein